MNDTCDTQSVTNLIKYTVLSKLRVYRYTPSLLTITVQHWLLRLPVSQIQ